MQAASSSDSDHSESEESEDSQRSQDGSGTSEHESDLDDFIVDVDPAAAGPDDGGVGPGPSATAVSAMLEEAGMVSSRTDKEHFTIYIEYLVYDLVDNTFAVRVRGNSRLRKHFDAAVRHVEESLAFKRCVALLVLHGICLTKAVSAEESRNVACVNSHHCIAKCIPSVVRLCMTGCPD